MVDEITQITTPPVVKKLFVKVDASVIEDLSQAVRDLDEARLHGPASQESVLWRKICVLIKGLE